MPQRLNVRIPGEFAGDDFLNGVRCLLNMVAQRAAGIGKYASYGYRRTEKKLV